MIDIKYIRSHSEQIIENCNQRNVNVDIPKLLEIDEQARQLKNELDSLRQRRNEINQGMKGPIPADERQPLIEEAKQLRNQVTEKESTYESLDKNRLELLSQVPNLTHPESPIGKTDGNNQVIRTVGTIPQFDFIPKDHVELMEALDLIDFEGGAKVAGQKFYFLKNDAVFLETALIQYALKVLKEEGFSPLTTPDLARRDVMSGTGFNPRGNETQIYSISDSELCLIATAEIPLAGRYSDSVLDEAKFPICYAGVSHCFRTEAGAAGRESKGLYRVHQFSKIEMFVFTHPNDSEKMHSKILAIEERVNQELGIPYQVVNICTGDLGASAYRKYDLEAWMPGRGKWGEITSASNCTDYQARRLNIRYKDKEVGKNKFVHMLNGTAIAIPRTLIALIENGQQADGSIHLPSCLGLPDIIAPK